MLSTRRLPWIKKEPGIKEQQQQEKQETPPSVPPIQDRMHTIRTVLGSYMNDATAEPEMRMVPPVGEDAIPLEEQVGDINEKTFPVADEPWQMVEEYEKDHLYTTGQTDILQARLQDGTQQRTRAQKKKRGARRKKRVRDQDNQVPVAPPTLQPPVVPIPEPGQTRRLTLGDVMEDLPIETLRQEALRNDRDARFLTRESVTQRIPEEAVASVIRYQDVVAWVGKMTQAPLWFRNLPQLCVDTGTDLPDLEVVTWSFVQDMLREPDPTCEWERPCLPPVDARTGRRFACESERMGGPRLREFLSPSQYDALMQAVRKWRKQPGVHTRQPAWVEKWPRQQRMCFLCHQKCITAAFAQRKFYQKRPGAVKQQKDQEMVLIHDYVMAVNLPGEWDIDATLPGYEKPCGLAGPVLEHDTKDYVFKQFPRGNEPSARLTVWLKNNEGKKHLDGWTMVDRVFFRPGATRMYSDRQ